MNNDSAGNGGSERRTRIRDRFRMKGEGTPALALVVVMGVVSAAVHGFHVQIGPRNRRRATRGD